MNMAAIYTDDLVDAFYKAGHAIRPINIRLGVSESLYVNNLNTLLTEISQFLLPALAQPGVNTTTVFAPDQPRDWIYWLKKKANQENGEGKWWEHGRWLCQRQRGARRG